MLLRSPYIRAKPAAMRTIMLFHLAEVKVVQGAGVRCGSILRQLFRSSQGAVPSWSLILRTSQDAHTSDSTCMPLLYPSKGLPWLPQAPCSQRKLHMQPAGCSRIRPRSSDPGRRCRPTYTRHIRPSNHRSDEPHAILVLQDLLQVCRAIPRMPRGIHHLSDTALKQETPAMPLLITCRSI